MKNMRITIFLFVVCSLLFSGCSDLDVLPINNTDDGIFQLTINGYGTERTIVPDINHSDFDNIMLEFIISGGSTMLSADWYDCGGQVKLSPGTWNLNVTAFKESSDGTSIEVANGIVNNIVITSGASITKNVILFPIMKARSMEQYPLSFNGQWTLLEEI